MWTDEQVVTLKRLWESGYSASLIGAQIGYTRNAILGKVFRLCLEKRVEREYPIVSKPRSGPKHGRVRDAIEVQKIRNRQRENARREERGGQQRTFLNRCKSPKTSAEYRNHLPIMRDMSKTELRAMLTSAIQNTAAMEEA